jgi:GDPmannose 4,6-dehydratase
MKTAIIFGITGQDGSYLADLLLEKDYAQVIGVIRRSSVNNTHRIKHLLENKSLTLIEGDVTDYVSVSQLVQEYQPDEIYNLAAQSHVKTSFDQPIYTWKTNAEGPLFILEAIRTYSPHTRFYQASTSEMFGKAYSERNGKKYQNEETTLTPQSPYAIAKLAAHHTVRLYRQSYDIFACSGILFNHESERRGELFVTRKISKWIADYCTWARTHGLDPSNVDSYAFDEYGFYTTKSGFDKLALGNLDAHRDWGHAEDYVHGMWLMLQQDYPDDYVLATGKTHTVRDFLDEAFSHIGVDDWENLVVIDPKFYRPSEVDYLLGDPAKANTVLQWSPNVDFNQLVKRMVESDLNV